MKDSVMSRLMMPTQADTSRYYREEGGRKTGHYKQEGIIIESSGSRTMASEVSVNSED